MYLQFLNYVSYFLNLIFIASLIWLLNWEVVKIWAKAKHKVYAKKAQENGQTPFYFNRKRTTIYANNYKEAYDKYQQLKREAKVIESKLKKA